jgi:hypothetical protein
VPPGQAGRAPFTAAFPGKGRNIPKNQCFSMPLRPNSSDFPNDSHQRHFDEPTTHAK